MASYKDTFEAKTFAGNTFAGGNWRGTGVAITDSIFEQCLDAIQSEIRSLGLADISNDDIVVRKLPWNRDITEPGIIVYPIPEPTLQATNETDDISYGAMVVMAQESNQDLESNMNRMLTWRESISKKFRFQPLSGVSEVHQCVVEPQAVFSLGDFQNQYDVGALLIRCISRESRG